MQKAATQRDIHRLEEYHHIQKKQMGRPTLGQNNSSETMKTRLLLVRKQAAAKAQECEGEEAKHE